MPNPATFRRSSTLQLVGFITAAVAAMALVGPLAGIIYALFALDQDHPAAAWIFPVLVSVVLLAVTWVALRLEGARLRSLGLPLNGRRVAEFGTGFVVAAALFTLVALVQAALVGASWTLNAGAGIRAALIGIPFAFVLLFSEELLFRGYAFRKVTALWGAPAALIISSLLFGAYHLVGAGYWGMGAIFLFVMPALGGVLFGIAALRTGGLALPLGLHLGGNWVNASMFGLGRPEGTALWTAEIGGAQFAALVAPDILLRLPYVLAVALLAFAVFMWPQSVPFSTFASIKKGC